ncbi:MAG: ComEC family competence protein, partial [Bacteroidetes bacterium]
MTRAPAFKACLLYSIGILAGWYFSFSLVWLLASIVVCSVGAFLLWRKNHHSLLASFIFVLIIITLGVCKITWDGKTHAENSLTNVVSDEEQEATIIGVITERATPRQRYYSLIIEANSLSIRNRMLKVEGDVIVSLEKKKVTKEVIKSLFYGRKVSFTGTIRFPAQARNPGEFDYRRYLYLRGVYAQFRVPSEEGIVMGERAGNWLTAGVIHPFRDWISETMDVLVGGEEANLLKGLVIGERSEIDPDIKIAFTNAGLMHILAVSGLNVGLVTIMFWLVFSLFRIPRLFVGLLTALCLVIFAVLTGGEASVVRAVIMANVFIGAKIFEQKTNLFNVVGLAALFMLLIDARWLFNVGFQLSFVAVLALAQIYPRMEEWMKKFQIFQQSHSFFKKYLFLATVVSLAATIGTLPFTIYYFHQFSIIGIFMNIIAVPLSGFVLVFGCLVVLTSGVSMSLGAVYALPAYWSARLLLKFTEWGGGWSHSAMELYVDLPTAI